jgi:mono/diheme cytochrome c family protein/cytochrome bd-type quinol oxidase subunit 1
MNYPVWDVPAPGLLIAAVAIVHVFISHFAVGGGLYLVLTEWRARRDADQDVLAFLKTQSRAFVLVTLVLGALTGVGIWFTIALVQPQATSALVTTFVWGWAIEWTFFAVEIAAAMVYYYGWDRLDPRTHLRVGWVYFVAAWASLVVINGILAFMLTSGDWPTTYAFAAAFFNPTYWPTLVLRTAVAVGLAGLYALLAGAFLGDPRVKGRLARWSVTRFVAPAAVVAPPALVWTLSAAAGSGAAVAETLGARGPGLWTLLAAVLSPSIAGGQPVVRAAALVAVVAATLLLLGALALAAWRSRTYGRLEAALLMGLGFLTVGGGEWVREGLRKPWVIDDYMFVNGIRSGAPRGAPADTFDPFTVEALRERGALASARWSRVPPGRRPGDPALDALPPAEWADGAATAGAELFRLECAACHTDDGHLGIRRLVHGKSVAAVERVLDSLAQPVEAGGAPATWSEPGVRLVTWLGRRMPPFAGTDAEERALAIHLARLGGDPGAGLEVAGAESEGEQVFEGHCAPCHGSGSPWPMAARVHGRSAAELYEMIGRLPEIREEMPPFDGTDEERRALADYVAGLGAPGEEGNP